MSHDSSFCLNGIVLPDRGLGEHPLFKTPVNYYRNCHGLLPKPYVYDDERVVNVSGAISKPTLVDAKQCMKWFDCSLDQHTCTAHGNAHEVAVTCTVTNLYDHIEDIDEMMTFMGVLLYNGIIVDIASLSSEFSEVVQKKGFDLGTPRYEYTVQEVTKSVTLAYEVRAGPSGSGSGLGSGLSRHVYGCHWPGNAMLDSFALQEVTAKLRGSTPDASAEYLPEGAGISVLVVASLKTETPWAEAGFPLGFTQFDNLTNAAYTPPSVGLKIPGGLSSVQVRWGDGLAGDTIILQSSNVTATIDTNTGMLKALVMAGSDNPSGVSDNSANLLVDQSILPAEYMPMRMQFHRAPTENDQTGFTGAGLLRWETVGLTSALEYVPVSEYARPRANSVVLKGLVKTAALPNLTVIHVSEGASEGYEGVEMQWRMRPRKSLTTDRVNKRRIEMIKRLQNLLADDSRTVGPIVNTRK